MATVKWFNPDSQQWEYAQVPFAADPAGTAATNVAAHNSSPTAHAGVFAPALGPDDNYVTDAEKTKLANTSGTNTGDQDLSLYALTADIPTAVISQTITDGVTNKAPSEDAVFDALVSKLPTSANIYTAQAASFTILADMLGKDVPITFATDAAPGITLPAWNGTGFGNGWQCKLINLTSTKKTFTGTMYAVSTKMPEYSSRVLSIIDGKWFVGGLTT